MAEELGDWGDTGDQELVDQYDPMTAPTETTQVSEADMAAVRRAEAKARGRRPKRGGLKAGHSRAHHKERGAHRQRRAADITDAPAPKPRRQHGRRRGGGGGGLVVTRTGGQKPKATTPAPAPVGTISHSTYIVSSSDEDDIGGAALPVNPAPDADVPGMTYFPTAPLPVVPKAVATAGALGIATSTIVFTDSSDSDEAPPVPPPALPAATPTAPAAVGAGSSTPFSTTADEEFKALVAESRAALDTGGDGDSADGLFEDDEGTFATLNAGGGEEEIFDEVIFAAPPLGGAMWGDFPLPTPEQAAQWAAVSTPPAAKPKKVFSFNPNATAWVG